MKLKVIVACEYSGIVRDAFSRKGHDAWSCDLLPTESELTIEEGKHIQDDAIKVAYGYNWDLMIAHPPCTYFSRAAGRWLYNRNRLKSTKIAFDLILKLWESPIDKICIENPPGWLCTNWKKPKQKIHPWYFGDGEMKETCLWLKNLNKLNGIKEIYLNKEKYKPKPAASRLGSDGKIKNKYFVASTKNAKQRSKFWPGIAKAMANQWG